jgi:hypothetical protein
MTAQLKARLLLTRTIKAAIRTGYCWPGGYPFVLITGDCCALCTGCARKEWRQVAHDTIKGWKTGWDVVGVEIAEQGPVHCDHCGKDIAEA